MQTVFIRTLVSLFLLFITSACTHPPYLNKPLCSAWCKERNAKGIEYSDKMFATYDPETQFSIYLCAQEYIHPPHIYMASIYARQGGSAVKILTAELNKTSVPLVIRDISNVFYKMAELKTYAIANDKEAMAALDSALARMPETIWSEYIQKNVRYIKMSSQ